MANDIAALNTSGTIHVVTSLNLSHNVAKGTFLYTTKLHKELCAATGELVRRQEGLGYRVAIQSSEDVDKDLSYLLHYRRVVASTTRLGDWSGRGHVGDQAEAGGACSSEHCSCWSHAELRHNSAKCVPSREKSQLRASVR